MSQKKLSQIYTLNLLKFHIGIYENYLYLRFCIHLETKHKQSHLRPGYVQLSINPKKIVIIFYFATKKINNLKILIGYIDLMLVPLQFVCVNHNTTKIYQTVLDLSPTGCPHVVLTCGAAILEKTHGKNKFNKY